MATRQQTLRLSLICQLPKYPAINQFTWISKVICYKLICSKLNNMQTTIFPNVHISDKSSLVKIMACHRIGKKTITWTSNDANHRCRYVSPGLNVLTIYSTTICKLLDLMSVLHPSDFRIPSWVSAKTEHSSSINHGQTTAHFQSFFR